MANNVPTKLAEHFSKYPQRSYQKRQILIHAGDEPQYIYYLASGKIRQYDISYRGDEIVVNVFKPGAFFPMLWAISQKPNKYFFDAETEAVVHIAPYKETVTYLKNNPDIMFDLLQRLYVGMDGLLGRMVQLMAGNAQTRLLNELLIEARRFGKPKTKASIAVTINESDLAARAGLSRETVSREIQKAQKAGLIKMGHGHITIQDINKLALLLDSD